MYEDLIKKLRNRRVCVQSGGDLEADFPLMKEAADAIEKLQRQIDGWIEQERKALLKSTTKWIPVKERLPEDLTMVIVFCEDGVSYGLCEHLFADDEEVVEWHDFLHYPITPTHWMPLPTPPKEET